MLQIKDTLVSLDLVEEYFECDLDKCLGECCIEGDAGAPLSENEFEGLETHREEIRPLLTPAGQRVLDEQGCGYYDPDGDLVTSIIDGRDCIFTTYGTGGKCLCALEKGYKEGNLPDLKPMSCRLYPVRLKEYAGFTAVNFHHWEICKGAAILGRKNNMRAYQFLRAPLERRFGADWWKELDVTAQEYLRQTGK